MRKKLMSLIAAITIMGTMFTMTGCNSQSQTPSNDTSSTSDTSSGGQKGTKENPFILGVSPMSGWYGWYGVEGTGIFEKNGVNVEIKYFPVYSDSLTAFYSNQVDGICIAASDAVAPLNEGVDFKIVLVNDNSSGADGLVVHDNISSVQDLKGKTVATEIGTLEHMFFLKILEDNGMTINDVNFTNMTINDAGPAFIAGSIDAAVLWEPTLSMAVNAGGKVIYSTASEPGLIPDTLAVRQDIIDNNSDVVQKVVQSWFDGEKLLDIRDDTFIEATIKGAELEKEDYLVMLDGVTLFDKAKNEETFKEGNDYTSLPYTLQKSAEFLKATEMIDKTPEDVTSILDDTFIKGAN